MWTSWQLLRHFGPGWAAYRLKYALKRKSGWLARRGSPSAWGHVPLSSFVSQGETADEDRVAESLLHGESQFFFPADFARRAESRLRSFDVSGSSPVDAATRLAGGEFSLFHTRQKDLGLPPDWHRNGLTGETAPAGVHWSRIDDFAHGDIKVIWDLNRFHFAFDLARAYARTGDERWSDLLWTLVEDWRQRNPPNQGANWKCGQECSLRAMAWCFALFAMAQSKHTTATRVAQLVQMLAFTAQRIASNIDYAVSQKNNHGISEAVGLFTIGTLLGQLDSAESWRLAGRRVLSQLARELIYDDGAFSQHSWNYHRLMLHDYVWAIRLGEVNGDPLEEDVFDRVRRAGDLLAGVMDDETGGVPCYGQDDGSLILPLNNCSYFDYRPVVQATAAATSARRVLSEGMWDEDLLWLFGDDERSLSDAPMQQRTFTSAVSGYTVMRSNEGFASTRAATFQHRPAQADMLHVDIWWRGQNIAIDPGTFSYNAPPPWNNPLATAPFHNTVTVDGMDQMARAGRFVWLPWLRATSIAVQAGEHGHLAYWQGQHDGYFRLPAPAVHRRAMVRLPDEHWLVLDRLEGAQPHEYRCHWLLADWPHEWSADDATIHLRTDAGDYSVQFGSDAGDCKRSFMRADPSSPRGWRARGYQQRQPALSVDCMARASACWFFTLLGPAAASMQFAFDDGRVRAVLPQWSVELQLANSASTNMVDQIHLRGDYQDHVTIAA